MRQHKQVASYYVKRLQHLLFHHQHVRNSRHHVNDQTFDRVMHGMFEALKQSISYARSRQAAASEARGVHYGTL